MERWRAMRLKAVIAAVSLVLIAVIARIVLVRDGGLAAQTALAPTLPAAPAVEVSLTATASAPVGPSQADARATPVPPTCTPWPTPTPVHPPAGGPPRRIVAPAIHLDERVIQVPSKVVEVDGMEVREWEVPSWAGGFHQGSAYPGHPGNTVISGHHNLGRQVFRYVVNLRIGDQVTLYVGETPYHYRVTYTAILPEKGMSLEVRAANSSWIAPTDDERLTLVTCWPYTGNTHRVIVVARPEP